MLAVAMRGHTQAAHVLEGQLEAAGAAAGAEAAEAAEAVEAAEAAEAAEAEAEAAEAAEAEAAEAEADSEAEGETCPERAVRDLIIKRDYGEQSRMGVGFIHHRERKTYVGDLSVFGDALASATVVAGTKCVCLVLHRSQATGRPRPRCPWRVDAAAPAKARGLRVK